MVKSTRSSQKAKGEENNNGRVTRNSEKAKLKAHPNVSDTAGIRKSAREKPSKNIVASSSSTKKSEQVEKGTLPAPEAKRKSERVEKMKTQSPLTRSGKTRNHSSSCPSDSKTAGSLGSVSRQKLQKEKSVQQLTFEAKEVNENEEHNVDSSEVKTKKMTAPMYRSLFKQPKKDCLGNLDNISKSNQEGDNSSGAKIDELSKGSCSDNKEVSNNDTLLSEDATEKETTVDSRIVEERCQSKGDNGIGAKIDELSKGSCSDNKEVSNNDTLLSEDATEKETTVDSRIVEERCQSKGDNGIGAKIDELDNKEVPTNGTLLSEDATAKETTVDSRVDEERCQSEGDNSSGAKIVELSKGSCSDNKEVSNNDTLLSEDATAKETTVDSRIVEERCQSKGDNGIGAKIDELFKVSCSDNKEVPMNGTMLSEDATAKETTVDSRVDEERCQSEGDNSSGAKIDELSKGSCSDNKEVSENGTLTSEDAEAKETRVDSRLSGSITDLAENYVTPGSFIPSNTPNYETSVVPRRVQADCCGEETLPTLVSGNFVLDDEDLVRNNAGLGGGEKLAPSKRKVITVDMDSNVSSSVSKGDNNNLIPDALPSKLGGNESCSKRLRLDYNPTVKESRDPCATEDGDDIEATMQQKDKSDHTSGTGHLKDSTVEDKNILALDGQSVVQPKEKLSSHIANGCKSGSFRFVEYWVPVQISHVQLEQYCATLLSNASFLCSSPKIDSVGAIRDVLISSRKSCNHPYIIDESVQPLLLKGLEEVEYLSQKEKADAYLNVGIKASGKLQLLDSMLTELRKNKLRALVLFQPIGCSGKVSIVDILDDFLRQRFGEDSYERIDNCLTHSKKQAATKIFNDKNNKRFVFLMETCACHPSIKLSSIDTIIIFDSDLNPVNDIRSLQKLTLDSQFELIKTFRLYSAFTVEEKALILARQGKTLDINCPSSSRGLSHTLLMWGASRLFDELRVFLDGATSTSSPKPLLGETVSQFSSCLSDAGEDSYTSNCSVLLKVQQNGGAYCADFPLFGELELGSPDEELPQTFWTKLLDGKQFRWKYSCSSSQRSRRRVQPVNNFADGTNLVNEGPAKKRMKVSNNNVDQPSSKSDGEKLSTGIKAGTFGDLVDKPQGNDVESEKNGKVHDELRSLHLLLKPQMAKLCEALLLPDNVKNMVDNFLEYVMNNHHFNRDPESILQAFQISVIWTAASFLKHKVDHKGSLILAKQYLNFDCKQSEVDYSFSLLRCLKKIFVYRTSIYNDTSSPKASKSLNGVSCIEVAREVELFKNDLSKSVKKIQKKCEKMLNKVRLMQQEEKHRLRAVNEVEMAELDRKYKIELAMTRSCSPDEVTRTERLNILNIDHKKSIEELKCQHDTSLKELEDQQSVLILKFQDWEATWVEEVKSWAKNELLKIVASKEVGTEIDYSQMRDNVVESMIEAGAMVPETNNSPSVVKTVEHQNSLVKHDRADEMEILVSNDQPVSGSEDHNTTENQNYSQENIIAKHSHSRQQNSDGATRMADEASRSVNYGHGSRDGCEKPSLGTTRLPDCREQNAGGATSMTDEDNRCAKFGHGSQDGCQMPSLGTTCLPDCENATRLEHQCSDGVSSSVPEGQIPVEVQENTNEGDSLSVSERDVRVEMPVTVNFTDRPLQNATHMNPPSSVDQISDRGSIDVPVLDGVLSSKPCQAACSTSCQDTISLSNPPLEQQIPDEDAPVIVPENSHAVADFHKNVEPSTNAMRVDNSTTNDQDGVVGTVTSAPVPSPVNVMEPLGQGQQLPSVESAADKDSDGEIKNSSVQVQQASSSADVVPANQITVPSKQVNQLAAAEISSNLAMSGLSNVHLATEDEHQLNSVNGLPTHHSESSSVVPNKDVGHSHSNSTTGLHSNQFAVHPISNSDLNSRTASIVRTQSAYRRNLSNPLEMNNHPIQSTAPSSSRRLPHLSYDPLNIEFERIQKLIEQSSKNHEDTKLRLKSDFEKELAELRRKYDVKFQEIEVEFQQTKKTLDTNLNTVYVNKILANAFKSKCLDLKVSGASGVQHDSLPQQLHQLSRQQAATRPLVSGSSSGESPATSLPSPSIAPNSQRMLPPGYNMSGTFSGVSARPPLINTTRSSIARDIQGGEIRAPAPHLHSSRPSIYAPPSSFNPLQRGIPSQTAPSNLRATSPSYAHVQPWQRPPSYQSDPQIGRRPDSAGRSATPNLPVTGLLGNVSSQSTITPPNVISRLSDVDPANLSRFGPNSSSVVANSPHQAASPNLVCLSDDE